MTREELENFISDAYDAGPDYPWREYPTFAVYRHVHNRKWFALVMEIPKEKLGLKGGGTVHVVNLRAPRVTEPGVYPAYHMNKNHWVSVALDGSASDETVKTLLDVSFESTY